MGEGRLMLGGATVLDKVKTETRSFRYEAGGGPGGQVSQAGR